MVPAPARHLDEIGFEDERDQVVDDALLTSFDQPGRQGRHPQHGGPLGFDVVDETLEEGGGAPAQVLAL